MWNKKKVFGDIEKIAKAMNFSEEQVKRRPNSLSFVLSPCVSHGGRA